MKKRTLNIFIASICGFLLVWGAYFFTIYYINSTIASFSDVKSRILSAMQQADAGRKLRDEVQANSDGSFDLESFIIHPEQTADVVQALEALGPTTGSHVVMRSVSTEGGTGLSSGTDLLRLNFSIDGSKTNVLNCIRLVEHLPYNTKIYKMSFSKSGNASSTGNWFANIDIGIVKLSDTGEGQAAASQ